MKPIAIAAKIPTEIKAIITVAVNDIKAKFDIISILYTY